MIRILDAHGLLAFLEREPGYEKVKSWFVEAVENGSSLLMTTVNYGEVYYIALRESGLDKARAVEEIVKTLPIRIVDVDIQLATEAARFKASQSISYADCFAAALARLSHGEVITGDREFKKLEGEIQVAWIT